MQKEGRGSVQDVTEGKRPVYSHSRLWLYESCPEAFKVKYIDNAWPDMPGSIELFLGSMVHESLEWLYYSLKNGIVGIDDLIEHFANNWKNNFAPDIRMRNGGNEHFYFNKGIKFLIDYYQKHKPFVDNTIDIEKKVLFPLDDAGEFRVQGYIDRVVQNPETGEYEVHDYKTNEFMKKQAQVDADRQLAFYHIGLQHVFGSDIKVKLIWHFLAHNASITSTRTQEQLDALKQDTVELIKKIESTTTWKTCNKSWCDWCSYKKTHGMPHSVSGGIQKTPIDFKNTKLGSYT